jgi:FKBP-type peptidyl-prolyl cis-trans isomerase FkpA
MRRLLIVVPVLLAACSPGENAAYLGCKTMSSSADIPVTSKVDTDQIKRTASGLGIEELLIGSGPVAEAGSMVAVHYTGWLTDGSKFDSSRDRGDVLTFSLGRGQVITGWDEGLAGMKVGGRRKLVIPPQLGYGEAGAGGGLIPPGATLVFDVELCAVK